MPYISLVRRDTASRSAQFGRRSWGGSRRGSEMKRGKYGRPVPMWKIKARAHKRKRLERDMKIFRAKRKAEQK